MKKQIFTPFGLLWLPCLLSWPVLAQERATVSGYVKDQSSGEGLIGASVRVQGNGRHKDSRFLLPHCRDGGWVPLSFLSTA